MDGTEFKVKDQVNVMSTTWKGAHGEVLDVKLLHFKKGKPGVWNALVQVQRGTLRRKLWFKFIDLAMRSDLELLGDVAR